MIEKYLVSVTSDPSGNATAFSLPVQGHILHMRYHPDANTPLDTGADITVTGETSGVAILTQSNIGTSAFTSAPRMPTHAAADGSALTYDGTHAVADRIALAGERIKVVVAQGGNTLSGTFEFIVDRG